MQVPIKALSISYKNAPLSIREALSLNETESERILQKIREIIGINEALALSTCNRTEVFYLHETDQSDALIKLLCVEKGVGFPAEEIAPYFQRMTDPAEAIRHLFRVTVGLESQVVGDLQITNQVKKAYQLSANLEMAGPFMHRLLHTIFFTNKRVVTETPFRDGAASVSYAAVELVNELMMDRPQPKILVVGLGEIGSDVVRNFQNTKLQQVTIINRTFEKARALAEECGYQVAPFEQVWQYAREADVIISAISAQQPFFTRENVENIMQGPMGKVFLDLSVPRSVDKMVEKVPHVIVHNIDDINNRASLALERRKAAIPQVAGIVEESMQELADWSREMSFTGAIQKFKNALEQIRQEEIGRYMKQMTEEEADKVDTITKNILNKIVKLPVLQLKAACRRGDADNLAEVLQELFDLERTRQPEKRD